MAGINQTKIDNLENELIQLLDINYGGCEVCYTKYFDEQQTKNRGGSNSEQSGATYKNYTIRNAIYDTQYDCDTINKLDFINSDFLFKISNIIVYKFINNDQIVITDDVKNNINRVRDILNELGQNLYTFTDLGKPLPDVKSKKETIQFHKIENMYIDIDKIHGGIVIRNGITIRLMGHTVKRDLDDYLRIESFKRKYVLN